MGWVWPGRRCCDTFLGMGEVVVTGVGCISPIGIGFSSFVDALRRGESGIGPVTLFDASGSRCKLAAEVTSFDPLSFMELREARALPRVAQFAVAASRMALADARLEVWPRATRIGVVLGTSSGPLAYALEQHAVFLEKGVRRTHPSLPAYAHNSVISSECAIQCGLKGPALTISSACTSAADAIGIGCGMIKAGVVDALLVGGADAPIMPALFAAFDRLGLMPVSFNDEPSRAARPFSADREGLVLGEGAAIFVIEDSNHASARGVVPLARVSGYGATCDASSHFHQEQSGVEAVRALEEAISGWSDRVDYINAHGTGTFDNDPFEAKVLRTVFGARLDEIPVSASKSQFGHLLGACAAIEAAVVVAAIQEGVIPATLNLERPEPECRLNHIVAAREGRVDAALSVSFGFGSRNAALLFTRCSDGGT